LALKKGSGKRNQFRQRGKKKGGEVGYAVKRKGGCMDARLNEKIGKPSLGIRRAASHIPAGENLPRAPVREGGGVSRYQPTPPLEMTKTRETEIAPTKYQRLSSPAQLKGSAYKRKSLSKVSEPYFRLRVGNEGDRKLVEKLCPGKKKCGGG